MSYRPLPSRHVESFMIVAYRRQKLSLRRLHPTSMSRSSARMCLRVCMSRVISWIIVILPTYISSLTIPSSPIIVSSRDFLFIHVLIVVSWRIGRILAVFLEVFGVFVSGSTWVEVIVLLLGFGGGKVGIVGFLFGRHGSGLQKYLSLAWMC